MTLKRLRSKRVAIQKIAATHGARTIRVFGSVARGDARLASDIDFLVDMEPGRNALDLSELAVDLEEELGRPVAVVEIRRLSSAAAALQANALRL